MAHPPAAGAQPALNSITAALKDAILAEQADKAYRTAQNLELQLANHYIKLEAWDEALKVLRPLWHNMAWRREGWWDLVEAVARLLLKVAVHIGDGGTVVAVQWELMNRSRPTINADITPELVSNSLCSVPTI